MSPRQKKDTRVVSGFPGVGKSELFRRINHDGLVVLDSDSSSFSWSDPVKKVRNPKFPQNYVKHIQKNRGTADLILVSSHEEVRKALVEQGIFFYLVYPMHLMKDEYIQRYIDRGNAPEFVELLKRNYETWIGGLMSQKACYHAILGPGQYLSDVLPQILE